MINIEDFVELFWKIGTILLAMKQIKYLLQTNGEQEYFENYKDAVEAFRYEIVRFLDNPYIEFPYKGSPIELELHGFFNYKRDKNEYSAKDMNAERLYAKLFRCLWINDMTKAENEAISLIKNSSNYYSTDEETDEVVEINIEKCSEEITLFVRWVEIDTYPEMNVETNAFIFSNPKKELFFRSNQCLSIANKEYDLGKTISVEVILKPIDSFN